MLPAVLPEGALDFPRHVHRFKLHRLGGREDECQGAAFRFPAEANHHIGLHRDGPFLLRRPGHGSSNRVHRRHLPPILAGGKNRRPTDPLPVQGEGVPLFGTEPQPFDLKGPVLTGVPIRGDLQPIRPEQVDRPPSDDHGGKRQSGPRAFRQHHGFVSRPVLDKPHRLISLLRRPHDHAGGCAERGKPQGENAENQAQSVHPARMRI